MNGNVMKLMFGFFKKKASAPYKENHIWDLKQHIVFFDQGYDIDVMIEMEADDAKDISDESFAKILETFQNQIPAIQDRIEEFVRNDYETILENYYVGLEEPKHKSKEYQEHLAILKDFEEHTAEALDIVLKKLRPKYFAIIAEDKGYFLADIHEWLAYSIDAVISLSSPEIVVKMHDGDFE